MVLTHIDLKYVSLIYRQIHQKVLNGKVLNRIDWPFCYKRKNFHDELKKTGNMTKFMTPKGHRVIRGHCDLLYDHKGHGDHLLSVWPSLWPKRGHRVGHGDLLYDPKGHGDLCLSGKIAMCKL